MRKLVVALFLLCAAVSPSALHASVIDYHFAYTGLSNGDADFSFDIITPGFITTTGLSPIAAIPTSLGYTILNYGENISGEFLFSNTGGAIDDLEETFSGTSFAFNPDVLQADYYQTLGTFTGFGFGNAPSYFNAHATLTITSEPSATTPEPSTIGLLGTGLTGLFYVGRRRFLRS
jgi:PEP-CTERM motif